MYKKHLISALALLCTLCFALIGATLFSAEVYPVSVAADIETASRISSAETSSTVVSAVSSSVSSVDAKPKKPSKKTSSIAASSRQATDKSTTAGKPSDYIPEVNDNMQKIPDPVKQESSKKAASASKTSSRRTPSKDKSSSSKTPSDKLSSDKPPSTTVTSSESQAEQEYIYLSVDGEVKKYTAFEAVAYNVAAEMDDYFAPEALKAQAVAAHTYMVYSNAQGNAPKLPLRAPSESIKSLVRSVMDKLIYYDGKPINAVYCAMSGGYTANAADIWGGDIPYLKSVESKYDCLQKNYKVDKVYTQTDFQKIISDQTGISLTGAPEAWLKILDRADGGYVGSISLGGKTTAKINGKKRTLTGYLLRDSILKYGIRSSKFDYAVNGGNVVFTTYGYGHGVGMSQDGADGYAKKENRDYIWILKHYYTGVTVK